MEKGYILQWRFHSLTWLELAGILTNITRGEKAAEGNNFPERTRKTARERCQVFDVANECHCAIVNDEQELYIIGREKLGETVCYPS